MYQYLPLEEREAGVTYAFITDNDLRYLVKFTPATYQFSTVCQSCQSIYEVRFEKDFEGKSSPDRQVQETIVEILREFVGNYRCPLIYTCDSLDNREMCRVRLFQQWFDEYAGDAYQHDYRVFESEDYNLAIGIIAFSWDINFREYFAQLDIM
ncbi:hypothetical protein DYBT9623_00686 [Dyadobacter sp. CECT 9623]|uniref:Uncharacterized protein n=1 Tax=Dyadobacter linearis TaxID=2823330 RepID=A0ABM8UKL8_9BACT|nr:DUF6169 family protein [Dyadobacter sp. CECT 9623]CAG5067958.1 hypothetical protein DYBT9623_00686 [Dyadobacter sp. CECT 9623]